MAAPGSRFVPCDSKATYVPSSERSGEVDVSLATSPLPARLATSVSEASRSRTKTQRTGTRPLPHLYQ